jgi:hypothetical protein
MFEMIPYRCGKCSARFYAYRAGEKSSKLRTNEERKLMELRRQRRWKRSRRELLGYGFGFLIMTAVVYWVLQQRM